MSGARGLRLGEIGLGVAVAALGIFVAVETAVQPTPATQAAVGPTLFPYMIASGLVVVGLLLLREAFAGARAHGERLALDWRAVAIVSAAIILAIAALEWLGWIIVAALMFALVAYGFGSRRLPIDLAIGVVLSGLTFVLFDYGLGLDLPGGIVAEYLAPDEDAD